MKISKEEITFHDRIVGEVAKREFRYPDHEHPNWHTIPNKPNSTLALRLGSTIVFPDIAIVDNERVVQMIGEIEIEETVNEAEIEKWEAYSDYCLGELYVYVPEVRATIALKLLNSNNIRYARLIQYSFFYGEIKFQKI